jgi:hypothetical protein
MVCFFITLSIRGMSQATGDRMMNELDQMMMTRGRLNES